MNFKIYLLSSVLFVFPPKAWLSEVEGKTGGRGDRRHSSDINHLVTQGRERLFLHFICIFFSPNPQTFLFCPKFWTILFFPNLISLAFNNSVFEPK